LGGTLETARLASRDAQQARVRIRPGSNTPIVGLGKKAVIRGAGLDLRGTTNVPGSCTNIIIRNITFQDVYDCFPAWSPTSHGSSSDNAYNRISPSSHSICSFFRFRNRSYQARTQVLKLIANGLSNSQIADKLVISENTVKGHVSNILSKLHLADRTQVAVYAWRRGIVNRD
jgi:DNA-binding CsgD family transcriptional regulator